MTRPVRAGLILALVLVLVGAGTAVAVRRHSAGQPRAAARLAPSAPATSAAARPPAGASPAASASPEPASTARPAKPAKRPAPPRRAAGSSAATSSKKGASVFKTAGMRADLHDCGASWFYDWSASPNGVSAPGVGFVPMMWGSGSVTADGLATAKASGKILLGFNEPDFASQSNLTVQQALDLWPKLQATGMTLGAPAVATGADRAGGWLDQFMSGARSRGYRVDFIPLHWYGSDFRAANATSQLRAYVEAVHARYGKPIWVTEYALIDFGGGTKYPSPSQQAAFVTASTTMLQGLPYVQRYAWFSLPTPDGEDGTGLYRPDGSRTAAGTAYRAAR